MSLTSNNRRLPLTLSKAAALRLPFVILLVVFGLELWAILVFDEGHFIYTLDDAYIHLALAENIARGHYGVNLGEFSAPSSSIIWPFLLAPFSKLRVGTYMPLVINLLASFGSVYLFGSLAVRSAGESETFNRLPVVCILMILLIPITNVVGLLFTGMEHSLQVFLAMMVLLGIIREQEAGRVPWWLCAAIVGGPLVRYENLALALPALAYLAIRHHHRSLLLCSGALAAAIGGFSLFLYSKHLGILPTSVLAKSGVASGGGGLELIAQNLFQNISTRQGKVLSLGLVLLLGVAFASRRAREERLLASWAGFSLTLHLLAGRFGSYSRYEIYMWTTVLLTLIYLFGNQLVRLSNGIPLPRVVAALSVCGLTLGWPYASTLISTPLASRNIYEQQYQMHRFITQYWRGPVAVNDLGWTSYQNDAYVLDLSGLALREALQARHTANSDWMDRLADEHNVRLAMIYREILKSIPSGWTAIGELHLGTSRITPFSSSVVFYALDTDALDRARRLARDFQSDLPRGVRFVLADHH
jgi:hypothetical protein